VGQPAPEVAAVDLISGETRRLHGGVKQPSLIVLFQPGAATATELLTFTRRLQETSGSRLAVVGLAIGGGAGPVRQLRNDLGLTFPILSGDAVRDIYAADGTPKMVLLDAAGVTRGIWVGWGQETSSVILGELQHWLKNDTAPANPTPAPRSVAPAGGT
jgi:hypothetical protein